MVKNPLHQVVRDNALLVLRLAERLGFVPTARENLRAKTKQTDGDAFDRWAAGG
jgi:phage terminase small subunit